MKTKEKFNKAVTTRALNKPAVKPKRERRQVLLEYFSGLAWSG